DNPILRPFTERTMNNQGDEHDEVCRLIRLAYAVPPPDPDFVEELGDRLGRELESVVSAGRPVADAPRPPARRLAFFRRHQGLIAASFLGGLVVTIVVLLNMA